MSPARWYSPYDKPNRLMWLGVRLSVQIGALVHGMPKGIYRQAGFLPGLSALTRHFVALQKRKGPQAKGKWATVGK